MDDTMFLSEEKQRLLSTRILERFNLQYNTKFKPDKFIVTFGLKNFESICSIYLNTHRTDDFVQIKVYVKKFGDRTELTPFKLEQMEDYGPYKYGQVHVASAILDDTEFIELLRYANRYNYDSSADLLLEEDESTAIVTEDGFELVLEEETT